MKERDEIASRLIAALFSNPSVVFRETDGTISAFETNHVNDLMKRCMDIADGILRISKETEAEPWSATL